MEGGKQCKLCFKVLANGRALGGHMRSHLRILPIPDKTQMKLGAPTESASTLSSSAGGEEEEEEEDGEREIEDKGLVYGLRENPKRSFRLVDPEFLDLTSVVLFQETEFPGNPTRKLRSKRKRKVGSPERGRPKLSKPKQSPAESLAELSSVSDASPEEDSALSLMMLSRDTRFDSGEFMASHRCEICGRVFGSGQALGGHKRSHFLASSAEACSGGSAMDRDCLANQKPCKKLKSLKRLIDLNLPAPLEDDEDHQ